ncbi:hypothetical protein [Pseudomonas knackmussii]|uniref:hypothetical protein n=1 Tax=Pseudomonas knackmussii TaxID=65741 RepID=UPI003F4A6657
MAYYSGVANSFNDLLTQLVSACVDHGWTWADGILSKGSAYVKPWVESVASTTTGIGLVIQGGTGKSAGAMTGVSPQTPRMGPPSRDTSQPTWPMAYSIHIFESPDEVFLVARFNVDYFYFASFGVSSVPGLVNSGLWLSATSRRLRGPSGAGITVSATGGGGGDGNDQATASFSGSPGCFLWNNNGMVSGGSQSAASQSSAICTGLDGIDWPWPANNQFTYDVLNSFSGNIYAMPHIQRTPNIWNSEAPLLPVQVYLVRASAKVSLVADIRNARYIRVDSYQPEEIITLGEDRWKVYPFYRKSAGISDPGTGVDHTGGLGWAIRYDGP